MFIYDPFGLLEQWKFGERQRPDGQTVNLSSLMGCLLTEETFNAKWFASTCEVLPAQQLQGFAMGLYHFVSGVPAELPVNIDPDFFPSACLIAAYYDPSLIEKITAPIGQDLNRAWQAIVRLNPAFIHGLKDIVNDLYEGKTALDYLDERVKAIRDYKRDAVDRTATLEALEMLKKTFLAAGAKHASELASADSKEDEGLTESRVPKESGLADTVRQLSQVEIGKEPPYASTSPENS